MGDKRTLRDESTPIGRQIWADVDKAAAKSPVTDPTPKPWHGDPIDKPPMEYTPLPDPTPQLTAGQIYTLTDDELGVYINNATRKAFEEAVEMLKPIEDLIETVENRCMAADGPVTPTEREIDSGEVKLLLKLAWKAVLKFRALAKEQADV